MPTKREPRRGRGPRPARAAKPPAKDSRSAKKGPRPPRPPAETFPVVAIGASAGGLEAMTELLSNLPEKTGMAFIFIQHSAPTRESLLTEILSRSSAIPLHEIRSGMPLEPEHGYVAPPGTALGLVDGAFDVQGEATHGRESSIDRSFERLAEALGNRLVGIVLSGTLSDGALGLQAIKTAGGVTFAQSEESAKYPAMPRAALAAGVVDLVLAPKEIAQRLPEIVRHPFVKNGGRKDEDSAPEIGDHQRILTMLRLSTGVNFALYRQSTIKRRIQRRMVLAKVEDVDRYAELLRENDGELRALYEDILITVTSFFRDAETFETLKAKIFPALLSGRGTQTPVRVWVPGCATGEEAYSLAIALMESMAETSAAPAVQIFGTDISERAIEKARAGVYPESVLAEVSAERRRRFFTRVPGGYQVQKLLRDSCVFARQNVASDPPFSNLDILSCRNLLIYLEPSLQSRVLRLFHYALKPTGYLVLGGAETIGTFSQFFVPYDRHHRIFVPTPTPALAFTEFGAGGSPPPSASAQREPRATSHGEPMLPVELQRRVDRVVLGAYAPPGVLLNQAFDVLQFRGRTSPFLEPAPGAASLNVLKMAHEDLLVELRAALMKARMTGERVRAENVRLRNGDAVLLTDIDVVPLDDDALGSRFYLVLFETPSPAPPKEERKKGRNEPPARPSLARGRPARPDSVAKLEHELAATKEYLQSIIEEQQASNEELKSANEEILSSNEELQSTNEELETTKEELQSTNEELSIVNEELHTRNDELSHAYNDISNLVSGLDLGIVMLGADGTIRMTTAVADRLLGLKQDDRARRLTDVKSGLVGPDLPELIAKTMETAQMTEREVETGDGHGYLQRIRPYRTSDNRIEGVVIAYVDVDPLKKTLAEVHRSRAYAESILSTVRELLVVLDAKLRVQSANPAFHKSFQTLPLQLENVPLFQLPQWSPHAPALKRKLERLIEEPETLLDIRLDFAIDGVRRKFVLNAAPIATTAEFPDPLVLVALDDVTERTRLQEELREVQKLESIGTLAGGVAHDFNNILHIIQAHTSLVERNASDAARQRASLLAIEGAVKRGAAVVRQLLAFARKSDAAPSAVRVNDVIREMLELLSETFPRGIQIAVELDPALPPVNADANQLHQAFLNLCVNARDAMPKGGRLTLRTDFVAADTVRKSHPKAAADFYVEVSISDTGTGIDEETRRHIFEPFFTTKQQGLGSGLGLAVVYGVVNSHGGYIDLETAAGHGTTFHLFFPVDNVRNEAEAEAEAEAKKKLRGKETLLLVEDEESVLGATRAILEAEGYTIHTASDGREARETFRSREDEIAGVVVDLGLPGMTGVELLGELMARKKSLRAIAVSGKIGKRERDELEKLGVAQIIVKPFEPIVLLRALRGAFDEKKPPPERHGKR